MLKLKMFKCYDQISIMDIYLKSFWKFAYFWPKCYLLILYG